jgi:hypothetical protein
MWTTCTPLGAAGRTAVKGKDGDLDLLTSNSAQELDEEQTRRAK